MYHCIKWMKGTVKSTTGSHTHTCFATECEKVCLVKPQRKNWKKTSCISQHEDLDHALLEASSVAEEVATIGHRVLVLSLCCL